MDSSSGWARRFLGSTRGQVVVLLRRARSTVDELARSLGLTDNAVRAHLATLERDGLVVQRGVRRGEGKPAQVYELTPEAEGLFPKAYSLILRELLDVLDQRLAAGEIEALVHEVGRRIGGRAASRSGDPAQRAVDVLNALGGLAEADRVEGEATLIHGYACPLAEVLPEHPAVCRLAQALLTEVTDGEVQERCERGGDSPHCQFVLTRRSSSGPP
jgi:predicted ArsR family transcriptional regulator